jgi:hypothetical protein
MKLFARLTFLISTSCCLVWSSLAQQVGVTSTAAGAPHGTPPAQQERILRVGVDIAANERITTRTNDRAHLVFLDGSALTVGPSSDVVIDRFVYDADRKVGDLAMSASRGVFRFVGGAISKKTEVVVRTPTSSVGIRGSIMTIAIGGDGSTIATFLYGEAMTVTARGVTAKAIRPGSQILVAAGNPPRSPVILPPGALQAFIGVFEQLIGGGTGPGDTALLNSPLVTMNSSLGPQGSGQDAWFTYLQGIGAQGINTQNAGRPPGIPPTIGGGPTGGGSTGGSLRGPSP